MHDFAGHPFQIDLSRALARRGFHVLHVYCDSYTSGKGRFEVGDDEPNLSVVALPAGRTFARYSPLRRFVQEIGYGRRFVELAEAFGPDIILACNVPLLTQRVSAAWCQRHRVPWVFWVQDLYSIAVSAAAAERAGQAGRLIGRCFQTLERSLVRQATKVVPITEDFTPLLQEWGVSARKTTVIENWAPLDDLPLRPRANAWRRDQGLDDRFVFLYSGTLGLKHRPELLFELAAQHQHDADVVVISEGMGEARLREMLAERPLSNLKLLPFQPFEQYPDILASADVLVALLEPSAGTFSVPSKVLSYLCASRPILGAIPRENLAARTIDRAGAGLVVPPTDEEAFLLAAKQLRNEPSLRATCGARGRGYAEATFDTATITDRFLDVIDGALGRRRALTGV
ncbi:MAG TPA: glycosyltransferase family 4 protein [Acidimicrobiales bacterium]|nr:glycosyltransferase family 4 protein [Acidimicrobiales bacterium]